MANPDLTTLGLISLGLGQLATVISVALAARNARKRDAAQSHDKAEAIAAAAKLVDDRADRDRRWMIEDRETLERKVQATADTLALKVAADSAEVARIQREHIARLADIARGDQAALGHKVEAATVTATTAVGELKALVKENTEISTSAFHEANGAKLLLAEQAKILQEEVERRNVIDLKLSNGVPHRRATDPEGETHG